MSKKKYNFCVGERLLLELNAELIEGEYDSGTNDRIDLINVVDRYNNIKIKDKLSFYRTEIVDIHYLDECDKASHSGDVTNNNTCMKLTPKENECLAEMTLNFIYINKPSEEFGSALSQLNNSETIGVAGLCAKSDKVDSIRILVVSTREQIYMFDIFTWPEKIFPSELHYVLASKSIQKVICNSQLLKASLWKCHKVTINNIFDVQVADAMLYEKETGQKLKQMRNLSMCLRHRLHLQQSLLEHIEDIDTETWDKRPLDYYQVRQASFVATYLITLKCCLHRMMMKSFHTAVSLTKNSLKDMTPYECRTAAFSKYVPKQVQNYVVQEANNFM